MLDNKINNKGLFKNPKKEKNENIELHSECILQMNNFHDKLLLEKINYNILSESYKELEKKLEELQIKYDDLLLWKENHNCNNNVNIDFKETNEYKDIILQLDKNIKIEDNSLYLELKKSNEILQSDYDNMQQQLIYLQNKDINLKSDEANKDTFEEQKNELIKTISENIELKYSEQFKSLNETIEEFKLDIKNKDEIITRLNNKKNVENKELKKEDKFINSIKIYKEIDNKSKEYISSYTFRQINDYNILRNYVIEEYNKEDYDDIINYMFKYISNKKSKWYFTKKIKRCLYLYDNYINSLKIINFSISFITSLSDNDWNDWIKLLDNIIIKNSLKNSLLDNINKDINKDSNIENIYNINNGFKNIDFSKFNFNFKPNINKDISSEDKTSNKKVHNKNNKITCDSYACDNKVVEDNIYCNKCIEISTW